MTSDSSFKAVVFAGGGSRCLWQVGFWEVAARETGLEPRVVGGVSAGAAMACAVLAGKGQGALEYFKEITGANRSNFYPRNLLNGKPPFPHYGMYRRALLEIFDREALARLKSGPEVRVLAARPPRWAGGALAVLVGFLGYSLEKMISRPIHPRSGTQLGFKPVVARADECDSPAQLADLILGSSCTPPLVPKLYLKGVPVLDGGLIDNVPLAVLSNKERPALILLTRRYPPDRLKGHPDRVYLQPSRPVEISKWDYTDPQGCQAAYDQGRRDAELFLTRGAGALQD